MHDAGSNNRAFRWSESAGLEDLAFGGTTTFALGISGDGATVVGHFSDGDIGQAARWIGDSAPELLPKVPNPPGRLYGSHAFDASHDGRIIVGSTLIQHDLLGGDRGTVWAEGQPARLLRGLDADDVVTGRLQISGDGTLIVGEIKTEAFGFAQAAIWDDTHGVRLVSDIVQELGLDLKGWELRQTIAASYDGSVITGIGHNANFEEGTWILRMHSVPEPPAWMLAAPAAVIGMLVVAGRQRLRRS
jgi:uncharacterized membrane protein